jgi:membrane-associated phospholipid phosphatase
VIAIRLMPRFRKSLDTLTGYIEEFRKKIMKHMVKIQSFIDGVIDKLLVIVEVVTLAATRLIELVSNVVDKMIDLFSQLTGPQQAVVVGLGLIAAAWKFLNLSFLASPLGIILALAAAIGLLVDDFLVWKAGGKSLINWKEWEKGINAAMDGIIALRNLVGNAFMVMVDAVLVLKNLLCGDFSKAWESAHKVADHFLGIFTEGKKAFTNLGDAKEKFEGPMASLFAKGPSSFLMPSTHPALALAGGGPYLTPSPQQAAAMTGGGNQPISQQISQTIDINVQASTNPEATAKYVAREQQRVNADLARNMKGVVR